MKTTNLARQIVNSFLKKILVVVAIYVINLELNGFLFKNDNIKSLSIDKVIAFAKQEFPQKSSDFADKILVRDTLVEMLIPGIYKINNLSNGTKSYRIGVLDIATYTPSTDQVEIELGSIMHFGLDFRNVLYHEYFHRRMFFVFGIRGLAILFLPILLPCIISLFVMKEWRFLYKCGYLLSGGMVMYCIVEFIPILVSLVKYWSFSSSFILIGLVGMPLYLAFPYFQFTKTLIKKITKK